MALYGSRLVRWEKHENDNGMYSFPELMPNKRSKKVKIAFEQIQV